MDRGNSLVEKENNEKYLGVDGQKGDNQRKSCNSSNYLFIQHLLKLEERWINKQAEIRRYVNGLQKAIKQKDMKIEMMEMENVSLRERLQREINQNKEIRNSLSYTVDIDRMQKTNNKKSELSIQRTEMVCVQNNDRKRRLQKVIVCNENVNNKIIQTPKVRQKSPIMFQQNLINESYSPMKQNKQSSKKKQLKLTSNRFDQFYLGKAVEKSPVKPMNECKKLQVKQKEICSFSQQQQASNSIPQINNESQMQKRIMDNIAKILKQNCFIPYQSQHKKTESKVNPVRESRNREESKKIIITEEDEVNQNYFKVPGLIQGTKSVLYYEVSNSSKLNGLASKEIVDNNKSGVILNSSGIGLDKSLQTTEQLLSLQSSSVNIDQPTLATIMKRDSSVRQRTTTVQIAPRVSTTTTDKGQMMIIAQTGSRYQSGQNSDEENTPKNCEISCITTVLEQEQLPQEKKQIQHKYKSSKTITFNNNQTQMQYLSNLRDFEQHDFHSENKLILPHNIDIECGGLSPYESAQQTPYQSPLGSTQIIKIKSGQTEEYEKISQVGTVKRNTTPNNKKQVQQREKRNKLELNNPYSHQIQNYSNNNNRTLPMRNHPNLSSQKVYAQSITISPTIISDKTSQQRIDADKKSFNISQDDPFSQLIEQTNRSKPIITSQRNDVQHQQETTTQHLVRSNFERKRTRFNTKFTNLEYSLTESNISMSEFDGSGMYGDRENSYSNSNSGINRRTQIQMHRMTVVEPIEEDVRNERESFKVDYDDNAVQAESEVEVRTSGNLGSNRLTTTEEKKTQSSEERVSSKTVSEESQMDKISTSKKQSDPKQHTMKLHGRATLLLQHNSQTEPTKQLIQPEVKSTNQLKQLNSTKKLSICSSQDSKLCHSNQEQQKEKQNEKEVPMRIGFQECNIRNPNSIDDIISQTSSKQKKLVDTAIQYDQSYQSKKAQSRSSFDHVKQQKHQPIPLPSPKNPSKSLIISYSRSNTSNNDAANDSHINNDWQRNNVQYNFKKTPKLLDSDTKNHNRSESYIEQGTKMKQPYFDQEQYECYTESNKSNKSAPFNQVSKFMEGRPRLSAKERNAHDSKSTTINNYKTQGANFYGTKPASSSSSQLINAHSFKKMHKFTTESQEQSQYERQSQKQRTQLDQLQRQRQRQRQYYPNYHQQITPNIDMDGILFENSMLRSYNRTLEAKVKKSSNVEKLMQKLNTQNFYIRNKIHKKSIY